MLNKGKQFQSSTEDMKGEKMKTLKNYDEVIGKIAQTMCDLDKASADYETDIYLYISEDGIGTVDTFVNPGGNSWLDDDHICVYCDGPHFDDLIDIDGKDWGELTDEEREEYLPDMSDYEERADVLLNEALDTLEEWHF